MGIAVELNSRGRWFWLIVSLMLAACGEMPDGARDSQALGEDNGGPPPYSVQAVETLMHDCLVDGTANSCACWVDSLQQTFSEAQVVLEPANGPALATHRSEVGKHCGLPMRGAAATTVEPESLLREPDRSDGHWLRVDATRPSEETQIRTRPVSPGQSCVEDRLASEQSKLNGQSLSLDVFAQIQEECGM